MFPAFVSNDGLASAPLNMTWTRVAACWQMLSGSLNVVYFELVLGVVVEIRSETSFGLPMASTSLPV